MKAITVLLKAANEIDDLVDEVANGHRAVSQIERLQIKAVITRSGTAAAET